MSQVTKGNPLALPQTGPYKVSTVDRVTGQLKARELFDTKEEAITEAKRISATGNSGIVYDDQSRCVGVWFDFNAKTTA